MYEKHTLLDGAELKILDLFLDLNKHYFAEISKKTRITRPRTLRVLRKLVKNSVLNIRNEANIKYYSLKNNEVSFFVLGLVEFNHKVKFFKRYRAVEKVLEMFNLKYDKALISLLFGSYVKNYATKNSDVDLLLIKENFSKREIRKIEDIVDLVNGRIGLKINPHLMKLKEFKLENELVKEVVKDHILLNGAELFFKEVIE